VAANYQWQDIGKDYSDILTEKFSRKLLNETLTPIKPMQMIAALMGH
jgi:hypothetical protein